MNHIFLGVVLMFVFGCTHNKTVVIDRVEVKTVGNSGIDDVELFIGDYSGIASTFGPNQNSVEISMAHQLKLTEKTPIMISIKYKYKDIILSEKADITSKVAPFAGKKISVKFEIRSESKPILSDIEIKELKD